jgi:membrane protein required for colicin V production
MTLLDISLIVLIGIFVLIGIWRGLVPQLFNVVGIVLAYFLASPLGRVIQLVLGKLISDPSTAHITSLVMAAFLVYAAVAVIGHFINKQVKESGNGLRWKNRMWGGIIGLVKGLLISLAILFLVDAVGTQLPAEEGEEPAPLSPSVLLKAAHTINPLPKTAYIQETARLLKDPETIKKIQEDPDYEKLLENENFAALLDDRDIMNAARKGDYGYLFRNEKVKRVARDKDAITLVLKLVRKALKTPDEEEQDENAPEDESAE